MRSLIEEARSYLTEEYLVEEKKDHLINKLSNLNDDQKIEVIEYFKKYPNMESKIDWNNRDLSYNDFKEIMNTESKTGKLKAVKSKGIEGLKEGKDYIKFPSDNFDGYIPMNHTASKLIASKNVGRCEGKWCTAMNDNNYFNNYVLRNKVILIYVIDEDTKIAIVVYSDNNKYDIFDADDNRVYEDEINFNYIDEILDQKDFLDKTREKIMSDISVNSIYT